MGIDLQGSHDHAAAIDRLVHHSVILEMNIPSYRMEAAKEGEGNNMYRSEKTDPAAYEMLIIFAFPQKLSIIHKNGNFICRWREIILDVSQFSLMMTAFNSFVLNKAPTSC